jgi:hypothetical protein
VDYGITGDVVGIVEIDKLAVEKLAEHGSDEKNEECTPPAMEPDATARRVAMVVRRRRFCLVSSRVNEGTGIASKVAWALGSAR